MKTPQVFEERLSYVSIALYKLFLEQLQCEDVQLF